MGNIISVSYYRVLSLRTPFIKTKLSVLGSAKETAEDFETQGPEQETVEKSKWQKIQKKVGETILKFFYG
jgi:hypothetical protein